LIEIYGVILTYAFADLAFFLFQIKTAFIYISDKRKGLGKIDVYCFSFRYVLIILIRVFDGAVFYTGSTTRAFVFFDIPGLFIQCYGEVSFFSCYAVNFSISEYLNVWMPADLGQFR